MAALASCWAFWASAALSWASRTLEFSSFCLDCIWLFWASSSAFLLWSWVRSSSSVALSFWSASLAFFMLLRISVSLMEISCITSLNVSSSYRSFTEASMATLPPSRSSCMAAMCCLKPSHWSAISASLAAISASLAVISCCLTPMLFCTSAIWLLSTPICPWMTVTFSFRSDSSCLAAASFFLAFESSFLCCSMDCESLLSLFCSEDMLVAAEAG